MVLLKLRLTPTSYVGVFLPRRMGIETVARYLYGKANGSHNPQSPAVLGVKPAIEDVNVRLFLAFQRTLVKDQIEPNFFSNRLTQP